MKSKFKIRQEFLEIRKKIPNAYRHEAAAKAAKLLIAHPLFKHSQHIACYLSFKDEFDSLPIIEQIWHNKKNCYLPIIAKNDEKILRFVLYQYGDALHHNQYSILEPINISQQILPQNLDMVIAPLLAFDLAGHRLGTGGGFYDKTFSAKNDNGKRDARLTGLAYAAQQTGNLPVDPWDIALTSVITERQIFMCPAS